MKRFLKLRYVVTVVIAVAVIAATATLRKLGATPTTTIPTVKVQRGDVDLRVYTTGELRPVRSSMLMAPPVNGTLQIVKLWNPALPVKEGDVVVQFDTTEQEFKLEQSRFDLEDAEENITKSNADAAVQAAQDKVSLLTARFDVRRAELDVSRNELLSSIDARKNDLALQEARRRLAQLEQDVQSRLTSNQAALAVLQEKKKKATLDMEQAQRTIASMELKATIGGLVSVQENRDATGGFFTPGIVIPEYREGDVVRPGRPIAEVLDGQMEVQSNVLENDRANIAPGQAVNVAVDALPGVNFNGKVKDIASLASRGMWFMGDSTRTFATTFNVDGNDKRLKPAQSVQVVITGTPLKDVLYVPAQALFEKNGNPVVYVRGGRGFEAKQIKIVRRSEARVVLEGVGEGVEIALTNPEDTKTPGSKAAPAPSMGNGK